jgi:hypothetical protein
MTTEMELDIDKSEDELELERIVFGDTELIQRHVQEETKQNRSELEELEDDQVPCLLGSG